MPVDPASYCRAVEAYLCRKNEGHLVRIVGPAFECVTQWAQRGVPLKIVFHGIDRYCERFYAKGPRRRPARIEFCEADVLDAFDHWRRAVGVDRWAGSEGADSGSGEPSVRRRRGLASHIARALVRLTALAADPETLRALRPAIEEAIGELDAMREDARRTRGEARLRLIDRLETIDRRFVEAARAAVQSTALQMLRTEAAADLEAFRSRMQPVDFNRAVERASDRLLAQRLGLPEITFH